MIHKDSNQVGQFRLTRKITVAKLQPHHTFPVLFSSVQFSSVQFSSVLTTFRHNACAHSSRSNRHQPAWLRQHPHVNKVRRLQSRFEHHSPVWTRHCSGRRDEAPREPATGAGKAVLCSPDSVLQLSLLHHSPNHRTATSNRTATADTPPAHLHLHPSSPSCYYPTRTSLGSRAWTTATPT